MGRTAGTAVGSRQRGQLEDFQWGLLLVRLLGLLVIEVGKVSRRVPVGRAFQSPLGPQKWRERVVK